jgi:hypothetical protein
MVEGEMMSTRANGHRHYKPTLTAELWRDQFKNCDERQPDEAPEPFWLNESHDRHDDWDDNRDWEAPALFVIEGGTLTKGFSPELSQRSDGRC